MHEISYPFVSVIIPVYNDSERLKLCLEALENQTYPNKSYEIIVVDNASEEEIKSIVSQFSQTKYTYESQAGSYAARNKGLSIAQGKIIAFTDSDCIPTSSWIEKGVVCLQSVPNCGLVAGRIDLFFQDSQRPTAVELYESVAMGFPQKESLETDHFGVTANLFTFKHVVNKVGDFNSSLKSGGDVEWGQRVFAAGYQQIYADDACIAHPARYSFSQLYKRIARIVGGRHDRMMSRDVSPTEIVIDLLETFKPPFRSFYRIWTNENLHTFKQKIQFNLVMFFVRYATISEKLRLYLGGNSKRA